MDGACGASGSNTSHINKHYIYLTKIYIYFQLICQSKQMILIIWKINEANVAVNSVKNDLILFFVSLLIRYEAISNYLDYTDEASLSRCTWYWTAWTQELNHGSICGLTMVTHIPTSIIRIHLFFLFASRAISLHSFFALVVCVGVGLCLWFRFAFTIIAFLVDHLLVSICVFE